LYYVIVLKAHRDLFFDEKDLEKHPFTNVFLHQTIATFKSCVLWLMGKEYDENNVDGCGTDDHVMVKALIKDIQENTSRIHNVRASAAST
jgi:hypothetical protein